MMKQNSHYGISIASAHLLSRKHNVFSKSNDQDPMVPFHPHRSSSNGMAFLAAEEGRVIFPNALSAADPQFALQAVPVGPLIQKSMTSGDKEGCSEGWEMEKLSSFAMLRIQAGVHI